MTWAWIWHRTETSSQPRDFLYMKLVRDFMFKTLKNFWSNEMRQQAESVEYFGMQLSQL